MMAKEALVRKLAFQKPPSDSRPDPKIEPGIAHATITEDIISHANRNPARFSSFSYTFLDIY